MRDQELLKRAHITIMENVYEPEGYLWSPYRCITPAKNFFKGIWNWDSAFHAIGISRYDTNLAKESISGFFKFQRDDGFLPDAVLEDGCIIAGSSKPPVFAWATEIVYKRDKSIDFVKEIYPKLVLNTFFWENKRSGGGLFFYDSEAPKASDYITRVKYESGWDNSVRWDMGITEIYPIDLNCFMVMTYRSLGYIASELNLDEDSKKWKAKAEKLSKLINETMWDSKKGYYADISKQSGALSDVLSPASFMPLYIRIASDKQAELMKKIAQINFRSKMPTVSFDNPEYSNDYWRGPTWLNVAYFAAKGLKNYNFSVANEIKESILNMCYNEKDGIFECYDSESGAGLYRICDHFSWSCVFITEFILNFEMWHGYGV